MIKTLLGNAYGLYPNNESTPITLSSEEDKVYDVDIYLISGEDIIGGYKGKWDVSSKELDKAESARFHVIEQEAQAIR